jgi:2-keto-3-deoxy-L-rhamnonate aldolase RhmA
MTGLIEDALRRIRAAGQVAGMLVAPSDVERYLRYGARFLYVHANDFLASGAEAFASRLAASAAAEHARSPQG